MFASFSERLALTLVVLGVLWGALSLVSGAVHALFAGIIRPLAGF